MKKIFYLIALVFCFHHAKSQAEIQPAPKQQKSVLVMNGIAHIGNGKKIENSVVAFRNGKLELVADATTIRMDLTKYDTIIYASGMHVYPGFIATNTTLGLAEMDAVRASDDLAEVGAYKPSVRSAIAYNTDSEIIPTVRSNGVLIAQISPRNGVISGTSSVMQLDAWNWEDALVREDDGIHLNWPEMYEKRMEKGKMVLEKSKSYDQQLRELETFFSEAKTYTGAGKQPVVDPRYEAMRGVFSGEQTLYVHAEDVKTITEAVYFKQRMAIQKMVVVGGYDAWMAADILRNNNVPVMIHRLHDLPSYDQDDVDMTYKLPALLYERGVKFCIQNEGDMERMQLRNLPFLAGTAVAYGLPYEEAVRALTLSSAEILGIADKCGSLESGKDATFFISEGDALDMRSNKVVYAFIEGRKIDLRSRQSLLYDKYSKKYGN